MNALRELFLLFEELRRRLRRIERELFHERHTHHIGVILQGAFTMNSVSLIQGQKTTASIVPLEADGVTQTPGANVSGVSWSLSDPSVSLNDNGDGTATITANSPNTPPSTVSGTVTATVTDADGTSNTFTQSFDVTVTGQPTGRTSSIGVNFSTPA